MKITILGTAPPLKTLRKDQAGTSLLVESQETLLLVDAGPGAVSRLGMLDIDIRRVSALLLTHHHWDHVGDVPFLVLSRWEASQFGASGGRPFAPTLSVFGPSGTKQFFDRLFGPFGAFAGDIATRLAEDIGVPLYGSRDIPAPFPAIMPTMREVEAGESWTFGPYRVATALALHCQPYLQSIAYRIEAIEGAFVFSGDSAPCDDIVALAQGADILFHDCNMSEKVRSDLGRTALHSTATEVGLIAARAGVKHVVAVHHGLAHDDDEGRRSMLGRIAQRFAGTVTIASSLSVFEIG